MGSTYARMTKPEREVAQYLKEVGLRWKFEFPVFVFDEHGRPRLFIPDFYIETLGVFIEVCGSEKFTTTVERMCMKRTESQLSFFTTTRIQQNGNLSWQTELQKLSNKGKQKHLN